MDKNLKMGPRVDEKFERRDLEWTKCSKNRTKKVLEYNITFLSIEKTGRKPCSIREHIIGIVVVSERDFDKVTCVCRL